MFTPEKTKYIIQKSEELLKVADTENLTLPQAEYFTAILRQTLRFHEYRYYILSDPIISDF